MVLGHLVKREAAAVRVSTSTPSRAKVTSLLTIARRIPADQRLGRTGGRRWADLKQGRTWSTELRLTATGEKSPECKTETIGQREMRQTEVSTSPKAETTTAKLKKTTTTSLKAETTTVKLKAETTMASLRAEETTTASLTAEGTTTSMKNESRGAEIGDRTADMRMLSVGVRRVCAGRARMPIVVVEGTVGTQRRGLQTTSPRRREIEKRSCHLRREWQQAVSTAMVGSKGREGGEQTAGLAKTWGHAHLSLTLFART